MAPRTDQGEVKTGNSRAIQLGATLAIGLVLGILIGRMTAPDASAPPTSPSAKVPADGRGDKKPSQGIGTIAGLARQAEEFIDSEQVDGLAAVGELISHASVSDLLDWSRSPENVSRRIINEMSDDELVSTITSITKIDAEDLAEYSDLRDYANRLSHIAMSGVITPDIAAEFDGAPVGVTFATDASSSRGPEDPTLVFNEDTRKIYAVIPNQGEVGSNVMVHWYRIDQPQNMLFDQYRISPNDDYSYVWLKPPDGSWDEGEYRVEFFSADEYLTPIASGNYRVIAD